MPGTVCALLTLAVESGYRDAAQLEKLTELEPVRRLCAADFAKLLADLRAKAGQAPSP